MIGLKVFYCPTRDTRVVESINVKFFEGTENKSNISPKEVPIPHQMVHVPLVVDK